MGVQAATYVCGLLPDPPRSCTASSGGVHVWVVFRRGLLVNRYRFKHQAVPICFDANNRMLPGVVLLRFLTNKEAAGAIRTFDATMKSFS